MTADSGAEDAVRMDLERILPRLKAEFPDRAAIVLVGGFGRGEGSVLATDGGFRPLNDYDFVVIGPTDLGRDLRHLRAQLASEVQVEWVDIKLMSESDLAELRPTMFNFDMKYGGLVLDGAQDLLARAPEIRSDRIPPEEAEILLFTRLWCFLGVFDTAFLTGSAKGNSATEVDLARAIQLSKAALACAESELILSGQYAVSYVEREVIFRGQTTNSELVDLVSWATRFKTDPRLDSGIRGAEQREMWHLLRSHFLRVFERVASVLYGSSQGNWLEYGSRYLRQPGRLARSVWHSLRGRPRFRRRLHANLAQLYTLAAWDSERPDEALLQAAARSLQLTGAEVPRDLSWEIARELSAQQRMHV